MAQSYCRAPFLYTCMRWLAVPATTTRESPMLKVCVSSAAPYTPGEICTPLRCPSKETLVLAGQYSRGRKSRWVSSAHDHAPTTGLDEVTCSACSTAALFC